MKKSYRKMTLDELRAETAQFDRPDPNPKFKPLTRSQRERFERIAKRGRGRPVKGSGSQAVMVSLEKDLLAEADQFADSRDMSRSQLIALGLRLAMKQA